MMKNSPRSIRYKPSDHGATSAAYATPNLQHQIEIGEPLGYFGPELSWRIYHATRRDTHEKWPFSQCGPKNQPFFLAASLFVFEKKTAEKLHKPKRKGTITELYKRGFKQLERMQHIRFLKVVHLTEESPDALTVVCEPVVGSLSDVIGKERGISLFGIPDNHTECPLLDLEIKCGIAQITEALIHLHTTEHTMHGNVCPEIILVSSSGSWKLAGLDFAEKSPNRVDSFPSIRWSSKYPKLGQPNLNFIAPEVQLDSHCSTTSDMFSLGMTICAIYNQGRSLIESDHSSTLYEQQLEHLDTKLREIIVQMPPYLQEAVENLLHRDPRQRPTAQQFSMTKYFNDPALTCLRRLDYLDQMFPSQKAEFFPALRDALHSIPRKMWSSRVLPALTRDLANHDLPPYAIYPLSYMIEHSDKLDYVELYRPTIHHILDMPDKQLETHIILLNTLHSFAKVAQPDEINQQLIPVLEAALQSLNTDVLDAGIQCFAKLYPVIRDDATKAALFQSLKALFSKGTDYALKVQSSIISSLDKIFDHLSRNFVVDEILPILAEARLTYNADAGTSLVELYRHIFRDPRFSLTPEQLARHVLPAITPILTHPDLTRDQYVAIDAFVKEALCLIDKRQRCRFKLDALSPPAKPFTDNISPSNSRRGSVNSDFGGMKTVNGGLGGPHIVFTTGDGSAHSSRSSSPTHSSRRSSYANPGTRERSSSTFLNVDVNGSDSRSRTSPTTPERRSSFLNFQGFPPGLNPAQRRHSAVSIQSISSQMVSLFAGRTS